jgi:hypothetical protein
VVTLAKVYAMLGSRLCDALAILSVPYSRVSHTDDVLASQPPMLKFYLAHFGEHLARYPLDTLVRSLGTTIELKDVIEDAVRIHGKILASKGMIVTPVEAPKDSPIIGYLKGFDNVSPLPIKVVVGAVCEFLKELPLIDIPRAIKPSLTEFGRESLKLLDVVGLTLHQHLIVCDQRLDEGVVLGVFPLLIPLLNEYALDVLMTLSTGVAGVVDPLGEVINTTQTGGDGLHLMLG